MLHRARENHMYTTIPPENWGIYPTEEEDPQTIIDETHLEIEEYEEEQIIKLFIEEEEYFNKLIENEPQQKEATK